jgi:hypothetical protein
MTRGEFLKDCQEALRLLSELGVGDGLAEEMRGRFAELHRDVLAISPRDLQRYAEAIDWEGEHDPMVVQRLAQVLLGITVGLAKELESFQRGAKG